MDPQTRQARRQAGKSDPLDALEAARAAQSGRAHGRAKSRDRSVEAIRVLVVAKRSAREARIKALTQMRQLTFSAPNQLQVRLKGEVSSSVRQQCNETAISDPTKWLHGLGSWRSRAAPVAVA